jgi:ribosome biogenesis protein Nip4
MFKQFIHQFISTEISYVQIGDKYFLKNPELASYRLPQNEQYFGIYLGEIRKNTFYPAVGLLDLLAQISNEKVVVNHHGELDFLYGKHLRKRHIISLSGNTSAGSLKLVQNEHDENLGYGSMVTEKKGSQQVLRHIFDRGIFIQRDKNPDSP